MILQNLRYRKMNEIVKQEVAKNGVARQYSPSFIISITEFLKKINPVARSFCKCIRNYYMPEQG